MRKREQRMADFFADCPLGLLWVGPDGQILHANQAQLELLGWTKNELVGQLVTKLNIGASVAADVLERLAAGETVHNHPGRLRHRTGDVKHVLIDANGVWEHEQLVCSRWFFRDITDRIELQREILTISEKEQRRLGHDLHDDLCQQLAGIQFLSQTLARELADRDAVEAALAKEIAQSVQAAMAQTRELARGLSPVGMGAEGLMEGLRQLAGRTKKTFRVDCRFACRTPVLVPDHTVAIHLYRIAQEALSNAIKHGKASLIELTLSAFAKTVRLAVHDNGVGIAPNLRKSPGMGLRIMRYRAGVLGGALFLQRGSQGGTILLCTVPEGLLPPERRNVP